MKKTKEQKFLVHVNLILIQVRQAALVKISMNSISEINVLYEPLHKIPKHDHV